jgi:hypothetical protein
MRSEVFTAVKIHIMVSWVMESYTLLRGHTLFGGMLCFNFLGRIVSVGKGRPYRRIKGKGLRRTGGINSPMHISFPFYNYATFTGKIEAVYLFETFVTSY